MSKLVKKTDSKDHEPEVASTSPIDLEIQSRDYGLMRGSLGMEDHHRVVSPAVN
jgi:hypothetical protein